MVPNGAVWFNQGKSLYSEGDSHQQRSLLRGRVPLARLTAEMDSPASGCAVMQHKKHSWATMSLQLLVAVVGTSGEGLSGHP